MDSERKSDGSSCLVGDRELVQSLIPHRAPFLFVDRILERGGDSIVVERDFEASEPAFEGHYPGQPVLPGVLISELCFQGAALLLADPAHAYRPGDPIPVLTRIEAARFKKMVGPGETLRAEIELLESVGTARYMKARVTSAGARVLDVRFTVAQVPTPIPAAPAVATPPIVDLPRGS